MLQVLGATYRIVQRGSSYEIVRVLDDRVVGAFRHATELEVIGDEAPEQLLVIARAALRAARLEWSPPRKRRQTLGAVPARWLSSLQDRLFAWFESLVVVPRAIRTSASSPFAATVGLRRHR
jgi:hypothetical protein